jgi:hypothetical protein
MRGKAYRRAQQKRMISKAMKIVKAENWYSRKLVNNEWVDVKLYDPRTEAKKWANNLAKCSCEMCTGHKRGPYAEPTMAKLKHDVSTRQQLEDYRYATNA